MFDAGCARTDGRDGACEALAGELTRVLCGDVALDASGPVLQDHLRTCEVCAELLRDGAWLIPALAGALRPAPLPAELIARIERGLSPAASSPPSTATQTVLRFSLWRAPLAAAAAIVLILFWPGAPRDGQPSTGRADAVSLSRDEAADLVAAFGLVQWDVAEISVASAASDLNSLEQSLERNMDAETVLPWSAEEDWDMPPPAGSGARPPDATWIACNSALLNAAGT